jgi:phosphate transport system substrate-binding protein
MLQSIPGLLQILHSVKMKGFPIILGVLFLILIASGCTNRSQGYSDTPTTGNIKIAADETFAPIMESQIQVFQAIYHFAQITPLYLSEADAFKALLIDSVRMVVASRKLNPSEEAFFKAKKIFPKQTLIAADAITLVVNPENTDSLMSVNDIKDILNGNVKNWRQLQSTSKLGKMQVVFDNQGSSTVRYMLDSIMHGDKLSPELTALTYNKDVVDYVAKNKNAIGIIGVNWVSDHSDSTSMSFLNKVKIVRLSKEAKATLDNSYKPYQAYIAQHVYPFIRYLYVINAEPRTGLASGFAAFIASDRGQRIILKSGILPATQPLRIIHIRDF